MFVLLLGTAGVSHYGWTCMVMGEWREEGEKEGERERERVSDPLQGAFIDTNNQTKSEKREKTTKSVSPARSRSALPYPNEGVSAGVDL